MKSNVIIADPPWSFDDRLERMKASTKRSASSQYDTLSMADIKSLDVRSITGDWCILALWVPSSMLIDGLETMQSWGFSYKTNVCWVKQTNTGKLAIGMGRTFRATHELALIGTYGSVYENLKNKSQRSVFLAQNAVHSKKPDNLHESLELMFPDANKVELFARRPRQNWLCLGDEIDGRDIRDAIQYTHLL